MATIIVSKKPSNPMENKKESSFIFIIIATILGFVLYKQFDFETLKFEKPALATVYLITFVFCIYFIVKNYNKRSEK
jgi:membrane protein DedA with SNARE-associated domain